MNPHISKRPRISLRPFKVSIPDPEGEKVTEYIQINIPMLWDEDISEWVLTAEAEEQIENTKARHMGLLLPDDLKLLRERHGLSQKAIGELLQIGAKSWTRWESGKQRPSRSINILLCALYNGLISPHQLKGLGGPQRDWSAQFCAQQNAAQKSDPLVIDFYRAKQMCNLNHDPEPIKVPV